MLLTTLPPAALVTFKAALGLGWGGMPMALNQQDLMNRAYGMEDVQQGAAAAATQRTRGAEGLAQAATVLLVPRLLRLQAELARLWGQVVGQVEAAQGVQLDAWRYALHAYQVLFWFGEVSKAIDGGIFCTCYSPASCLHGTCHTCQYAMTWTSMGDHGSMDAWTCMDAQIRSLLL